MFSPSEIYRNLVICLIFVRYINVGKLLIIHGSNSGYLYILFDNHLTLAIPTSRSRDVPSEALWRWFGSREDQDHCTLAAMRSTLFWCLGVGRVGGGWGVWGWWWLGLMMMLMMMVLNVFGFVVFCFVCLFVCDIRNCRTFTKNCSIASLFRLDFSVSCHFLHSESADWYAVVHVL